MATKNRRNSRSFWDALESKTPISLEQPGQYVGYAKCGWRAVDAIILILNKHLLKVYTVVIHAPVYALLMWMVG